VSNTLSGAPVPMCFGMARYGVHCTMTMCGIWYSQWPHCTESVCKGDTCDRGLMDVLSRNLPGATEENDGKQAEQQVSRARFEPNNSRSTDPASCRSDKQSSV
jgi:hypothetical protein